MTDLTPANDVSEAPSRPKMPMLYKAITPIVKEIAGQWRVLERKTFRHAVEVPAVPLMIEEFPSACMSFPILFSTGAQPVPTGLLSLQSRANVFCDVTGQWRADAYVPAYFRRYPFILVRKALDSDEWALCMDGEAPEDILDKRGPGNLFENGEPGTLMRNAMNFCQRFEIAMGHTRSFCQKMSELGLYKEAVFPAMPNEKPLRLEGFQILDEEKLRGLPGETIAELNKANYLGLIYAHWFSMERVRVLAAKRLVAPFPRL